MAFAPSVTMQEHFLNPPNLEIAVFIASYISEPFVPPFIDEVLTILPALQNFHQPVEQISSVD